MPHPLSLDHLTIAEATPPDLIEIAAATGCSMVSLYLEPATWVGAPPYELIGDSPLRRDTRRRLAATGITLGVVEPFLLAPDSDLTGFLPALETAAWLGAKSANVLCFDADRSRRRDAFAAFCAMADAFGLAVLVEFFALSELRSPAEAADLVVIDGIPRARITVDALHLTRCGASADDLRALPPSLVGHAQLCDGRRAMAVDRQAFEASEDRLAPGAGEFDLLAFMKALPPDVPIGVEVPSKTLKDRGLTMEQRARTAVDAARHLLQVMQ